MLQSFLFSPLNGLKILKPKSIVRLAALVEGDRIIDVLLHLPTTILDRAALTATGRVIGHSRPKHKHAPHRVHLQLKHGEILQIAFFHRSCAMLEKILPIGHTRIVSGKKSRWDDVYTMVNPDYVYPCEQASKIPVFEPIYPLIKGVSNPWIRLVIEHIFSLWPPSLNHADAEWWPQFFLTEKNWPSFQNALHSLHFPTSVNALDPCSPSYQRLCADEWLAHIAATHIALLARKGSQMRERCQQWHDRIGKAQFTLTQSQLQAISDIAHDMAQDKPMLRLLQGDVGSGKTLIAEWALINAVEAGYQGAFMVPTDILAHQHYQTLKTGYPNISLGLLTQSVTLKKRQVALQELKAGKIQILVGTHALFQKEVSFAKLGICIIDEQHRFGVKQRQALIQIKNSSDRVPHTLLMSATPIPRTLSLALYGHIDTSLLSEKPLGRATIQTVLISMQNISELIERLKSYLGQTHTQAYWVCPLIDISEYHGLSAIAEREKALRQAFGNKLGILHGRMKPAEKEAAMRQFIEGHTHILLSTSVIEVGVHVPNACVMVIENAQVFGLSQLHQLRGRVGRSTQTSFCILLYQEPLNNMAKERLKTLRTCSNGFILAQKDLVLRGSGEKFGIKQSGHSAFIFIDLDNPVHQNLAQEVRAQKNISSEMVTTIFANAQLTRHIFS